MFRYRPFAPRVLEGKAVKLMTGAGRYLSDGVGVDVEQMLEEMSYQIVYRRELPGEVDAFCVKGGLVIVRESALENLERYRFTIAEEMAHIKIHLPILESFGFESVLDAGLSASEYKKLEDDAKYLGAAILMDGEKFQERYYFHADNIHPRRPDSQDSRQRRVIRQCASDFHVTLCASARRAQSLNLISKEVSIKMTT